MEPNPAQKQLFLGRIGFSRERAEPITKPALCVAPHHPSPNPASPLAQPRITPRPTPHHPSPNPASPLAAFPHIVLQPFESFLDLRETGKHL